MATGFFFCLLGIVFPLVFPYESEKDGPVKIYAQIYLQAPAE